MRGEPARDQVRAALTHPLWLVALAVLVLNDHVLKGAGILPEWLTGKLSDVAGLVVAPALVAFALRLRGRAALLVAHVAVGAVFSAINLWPAAARAVEALTALGPVPWRIVTDPTDVLMLPALVASWRLLTRPAPARPVAWWPAVRRWGGRLAFGAGALACMATSPDETAPPNSDYYDSYSDLYANLALANVTDEAVVVRVRSLRSSILVGCDAVAVDPPGTLSRVAFGPPIAWSIEPGTAISLTDGMDWGGPAYGQCPAFLVDGPGLAERLVFFQASDYPATYLKSSAGTIDPARTITITGSAEGGYAYSSHAALLAPPPLFDGPAPPECVLAAEAGAVAWSKPLPVGELVLEGLTGSPDGCTRLDLALEAGGATTPWYVCHPGVDLPFLVGDGLRIHASTLSANGGVLEAVQIVSAAWTVTVGRGTDLPALGAGTAQLVFSAGVCGPVHDACGAALAPVDVELRGDAVGEASETGAAPRSIVLVDGTIVTILRAVMAIVADTDCGDVTSVGAPWVESVVVGASDGADVGSGGDADAGSWDDAGSGGDADAGSWDDAGDAGATVDGGAVDDGGATDDGGGPADAGQADAGSDDVGHTDAGADAGDVMEVDDAADTGDVGP